MGTVMCKKLEASTLLETLISMVIVLTCITVSTIVYTNVLNSENARQLLSAELLMDEISYQTQASHEYVDEEITVNQVTIEKKILPYEKYRNISILHLRVLNANHNLVAERKELVVIQ